MNLDREIKEALMRHETDVREAPAAFDGVERKIRRAHQRRVAAAGTFVVALLVAAAASVVALRTDQATPPDFGGNGDDPPAPTASPTPHLGPEPGQVTFWDPGAGFAMFIPDSWRVTEFEGNVELLPQGEIGTTEGEDTFAVEIQLRMGESYTSAFEVMGSDGDQGRFRETTIAERPAQVYEYEFDQRQRGATYSVDWPSSYCRQAGCTKDPNMLLMNIISSTPDRWERYGEIAIAAVENLQAVATPGDVPAGPIFTRRGSIDGGVAVDDRVQLLAMFLEARVRGGGAEQYLAPGARTQGYGLYTFDDETNPYVEYRIESCSPSNDTSLCSVRMTHVEPGDSTCCEFLEEIAIGAHEGKGLKILSIVEEGASGPGGP